MATNRLYLYDTENGESLLLAKAFGSNWLVAIGPHAENGHDSDLAIEHLRFWLYDRDPCGVSGGRSRIMLVDEAGLNERIAARKLSSSSDTLAAEEPTPHG